MRADALASAEVVQLGIATPHSARVHVEVLGLSDDEQCSKNARSRDLCVTHFRRAFESGLSAVTRQLYTAGVDAPEMTIAFRVVKLSHSVTSLGSGGWSTNRVDLDWALMVTDANGNPMLDVQRSTQSPQPITWGGNHDAVIARLIGATLQDTSRALSELSL